MSSTDEGRLSLLLRKARRVCAGALVMCCTVFGVGCRGKSAALDGASQAEALRSLEEFLTAVQKKELKVAYACLSRAQQEAVPFSEFAEGYEGETVRLCEYTVEGIGEPDADTAKHYAECSPFLVPKGTLTLEAVKDDGITAPGQKRRMEVPLSWILMVQDEGSWRVESKGWGPLHTVAFFGRAKPIVYQMPRHMGATPMPYEDDARRYEITPSENWGDYSRHPSVASIGRGGQTHMVAFLKRSGSASMPNLTIQTYDVSNRPGVRSAMDYANLVRSSGRGGELRAPRPFTHDDLTGVRWEYEYRMGPVTRHSVTDYYLDGRTVIMVSSVSDPGRFKQDKEEIIPMLDSFQFTAKTAAGTGAASY